MNKLLSANYYRLKKSKLIYIIFGACVFYFISVLIKFVIFSKNPFTTFDQFFIVMFPSTENIIIVGIGRSVLTSLFLTEDFQSGTIRNKLIAGHTKSDVYLANSITSALIAVAYLTLYLLLAIVVGGIELGFKIGIAPKELITMILVGYAISIVYSSIVTFVTMLLKNLQQAY